MDDYFSLQVAMEEGFFSDLALVCCNGVALQAHKVVLELACPSMTLQEWNTLFSACSEGVARQLLHYVYTDRLPESLSKSQAQQLQAVVCARRQPKLARLAQLTFAFIQAQDLKQSEQTVGGDVHVGVGRQ